MDGAWTGHPDQNEIAVAQFPAPNQLRRARKMPTCIQTSGPFPPASASGRWRARRAAIRTVIRYRNGVLNGRGASLLDGYMEDLATDRIYRLMIAQRIKHSNAIDVSDADGKPVRHSQELIHNLFDQELDRLLGESAELTEPQKATLREARRLSEEMIRRGEFNPV